MTLDLTVLRDTPIKFFKALVIPSAHGPKPFGKVMAEFQEERFNQLAPALIAVTKHTKPTIGRYWWEATKGASKDSDLACALLWLLAFTRRPLSVQVGAADHDQADELRKAAKDILRLNAWLSSRIELLSWKIVCKATESEAEIIPADISGSHGSRPDVLILNELSHIAKQEFAENLLDNATKVPHGLVIIATNSGHLGTWQHRWRGIAETSDRWLMNCYSRPSPWLSEEDIAEASRRNSNTRFMRLFWGVWSSTSGDALDPEDIQAAINKSASPIHKAFPQKDVFYIGGLDLGIKQDHSALVILQGNRESLQLRLAYAISWKPNTTTGKVDLIQVEQAVLDAHRNYELLQLGYDPFQAELMAQRLTLQKVPMLEMTFTGQNLNRMASTLLDVFRSRRIELYNHPQLVADLGRLTIEEKVYGHRLTATRNEDGHADLATALAIALPLAVEEANNIPAIVGSIYSTYDFRTPYQRAQAEFKAKQEAYQKEMNYLNRPYDHNEPFVEAMRGMRRQ